MGRALWRTADDPLIFRAAAVPTTSPWTVGGLAPIASTPLPGAREFCIGAGGHTHYWDRTAPAIALELDRLVATPR